MNRILVVVAILQFLAIVWLGLAYFERSSAPELGPSQVSEEGQKNEGTESEARRLVERSSSKADPSRSSEVITKSNDGDASTAITSVLVYGSVRNDAGEDLEGRVRFYLAGGNPKYSLFADGAYSRAGLSPGLWRYEFVVEGYRPLSGDIELGESETKRLDVQMTKAIVLRLRVLTPEGEPLSTKKNGGLLYGIATKGPVNSDFPATPHRMLDRFGLGDFQGRASMMPDIEKLPAEFIGRIELFGDLPVHLSLVMRHLVLQTVLVPVGTEVVDFVVTETELAGLSSRFRVKLIDGLNSEPILSARIDLSNRQGGGPRTMKSEDGVYNIDDVVPGLMDLTIWAPNCGSLRRTLYFKKSELLDLGTLKLYPAAGIKGQILDQDGKGRVASIHPRHIEALKFVQDTGVHYGYSSNEKGDFSLSRLEQGRYLMRIVDKERKQVLQEVVDLQGGETLEKDFHFGAASAVEIHTKLPPEEFLFARLVEASGFPVWESHCHQDQVWSLTLLVAPGNYRWEVYRDLQLLRSEDIVVGGDTVQVSVR